jgi:ADP-heptose:LPS heptosyltransferase
MMPGLMSGATVETHCDNGEYKNVVISPFANERVREWPLGHFRRLIQRIISDKQMRVVLVGTRAQRVRANRLVHEFSALQVINECGKLKWNEVEGLIDSACCVITNNSGIGHFAAKRGKWLLCIFSASHSWLEWMPRGPRVVTITRVTKCSPCELGGEFCPNDIVCMNDLSPDAAYARFLDMQARAEEEQIAEPVFDDEDSTKNSSVEARSDRP